MSNVYVHVLLNVVAPAFFFTVLRYNYLYDSLKMTLSMLSSTLPPGK